MTPIPKRGYYCLIQYCPDLGRHEAANVGVLVFCPDLRFLEAKVERNNARIIRFFGKEGHDWKRINSFKQGIVHRLSQESSDIRTVDDLQRFIDLRANVIQISQPRSMTITDPRQNLDELFADLFGSSTSKRESGSLKKKFLAAIQSAGIANKVKQDISVPVPILNRVVEIPFGFQNGRFNLITPVRFESKNVDQALRTACKYGMEGRSLYEHPAPNLGELQLVVLGQFRTDDQATIDTVRRVFDEGKVKLYKSTEMPNLLDEIRRNGKVLST